MVNMTLDELKAEFDKVSLELEGKKRELDSFPLIFVSLTKEFVPSKAEELIKKAIEQFAKHTNELSDDSIKEMKKAFVDFVSGIDSEVDRCFSSHDQIWPHISLECKYHNITSHPKHPEKELIFAINQVFSGLKSLLDDYGYSQYKYDSNWPLNYQKNDYGFKADLPKNFLSEIRRYQSELYTFHDLIVKKYELDSEIIKRTALQRWSDI